MLKKIAVLQIVTLTLLIGCTSTGTAGTGSVKISAVQFSVGEELYGNAEIFENRVHAICRAACEAHNPDLIIFPEYTGAFLALTGYSDIIFSVSSLHEGFRLIQQSDPEIQDLHELFAAHSGRVASQLDRIFGGLAREFNVYILGGSYFHKEEGKKETTELYNRLIVYNPSGKRCYEQDKVFLTPFEKDLLNLSAGDFPQNPGLKINGVPCVFTICRDAFFEEWTEVNKGGHIWIDIKANGVEYDEDARETFSRALPERLKEGDVPYGITVVLTGHFLDLLDRKSVV